MTTPSSGPISMGNNDLDTTSVSINRELGKASPWQQTVTLNDTAVRQLIGKTNDVSTISLGDAYGKVRNLIATGGIIKDVTGYRYHIFKSSDTFTITSVPAISTLEVLVVGAGGSGGNKRGGGGGAGGVSYTTVNPEIASYNIYVGSGGAATTGESNNGNPGTNSSFNKYNPSTLSNITLLIGGGGGRGSGWNGSGGDGAYNSSGGGGSNVGSGGSGTRPFGKGNGTGHDGGAGGNFGGDAGSGCGSGGGAGGAGVSTGNAFVLGGSGSTSYGTWTADCGLPTALGWGGAAGPCNGGSNGSAGTTNTGGGGAGGQGSAANVGGAGGSGIVIVRYAYN